MSAPLAANVDEVKVVLGEKIKDHLTKHHITQFEAASIMKMPRSRVSKIHNNQSQTFTIDKLVDALLRLGYRVDFKVVKPRD
jgi:predicted XRE-type DNA-binding protein